MESVCKSLIALVEVALIALGMSYAGHIAIVSVGTEIKRQSLQVVAKGIPPLPRFNKIKNDQNF